MNWTAASPPSKTRWKERRECRATSQETRQNSGDLVAIKAQFLHLSGDMVVANATLNNHGTRLNVLTQDVREIRTGMGEVRAELTQTHTAMGEMRVAMDRRFDVVERSMALILAAVAPRAP